MKNWRWATALLLIGYGVGTAAGFATFYISVIAMWITIIVFMPVLFGYLCLVYLRRVGCSRAQVAHEAVRLALFWICVSFFLDALTYIITMPRILGIRPNWYFFVDQSPWIWLSYASLLGSAYGAVVVYRRDAGGVLQQRG